MSDDILRKQWAPIIELPETVNPDPDKEIVAVAVPIYEAVKRDAWYGFQALGHNMARQLPEDNLWLLKPANERLGYPYSTHWLRISMYLWEELAGRTCDWFFHLDDDAVFDAELYNQLRAVADPETAPFVSALAYSRKPPCWPGVTVIGDDGVESQWQTAPHGVHQVHTAPLVAALIHRSVFNRLEEPIFHTTPMTAMAPTSIVGPDRWFCLQCHKAGIPVTVNCDVNIGHVGSGPIIDRAVSESLRPMYNGETLKCQK